MLLACRVCLVWLCGVSRRRVLMWGMMKGTGVPAQRKGEKMAALSLWRGAAASVFAMGQSAALKTETVIVILLVNELLVRSFKCTPLLSKKKKK